MAGRRITPGADLEIWDLSSMTPSSLERRASEYHPALIHAFHAYRAGPLGLTMARRIGCPLVVTLTGTDVNLDLFDAERSSAVRRVLEGAAAVARAPGGRAEDPNRDRRHSTDPRA